MEGAVFDAVQPSLPVSLEAAVTETYEDDSISTAPYPYWKPLAHPQIQKGIGCVLDIPGIRSLCWPRLEFCTGVGMGPNPRVFRGNGVEKYVKPAVIMGTGTLLTGRVRFVQKAVGGPSHPLPFPLPFLSPPLSSLSPFSLPLFSLSSSFLPFPFPFLPPPLPPLNPARGSGGAL